MSGQGVMIFDCFTFHNELSLLRLRLEELSGVVDRFVIVESEVTFQGEAKPLIFEKHKREFGRFNDKIIHIVCAAPSDAMLQPYQAKSKAWAREYYQRDQIQQGLVDASSDDLVIVSDVDEIIASKSLTEALEDGAKDCLTAFGMRHYRFFVNRELLAKNSVRGPRMVKYEAFPGAQLLRDARPSVSRNRHETAWGHTRARLWNYFRNGITMPVKFIDNSVWHFTSLGDWNSYRAKVDAFAHEERKLDRLYLDEEEYFRFIERRTKGVPLNELPDYIVRHPDRFPIYEPRQRLHEKPKEAALV